MLLNRDVIEWKLIIVLNLGVQKQRKGLNLLFVLLQAASVKLIKEGLGVSIKGTFVERCRRVVILDKPVSDLNYDEEILLRINEETCVVKVRDAESLCRWSVLGRLS